MLKCITSLLILHLYRLWKKKTATRIDMTNPRIPIVLPAINCAFFLGSVIKGSNIYFIKKVKITVLKLIVEAIITCTNTVLKMFTIPPTRELVKMIKLCYSVWDYRTRSSKFEETPPVLYNLRG